MKSITSLKTKVKTKVKKLTVLLGSAAVMTLGVSASAMAASLYDITDLGLLSSNDGSSMAFGINNLGQVVGRSGNRAFVWSSSDGMTDLGILPGGTYSEGYAINDAGQVVGNTYTDSNHSGYQDFRSRAFFWSSSTGMTDLGTLPGGDSSYANSINNTGQVVGTSKNTSDDISSAFLWSSKTGMIDLGISEYKSWASDINDFGQIVGGNGQAFLLDSNGLIWPRTISPIANASAINNVGQIAGNYRYTADGPRSFFWSSSTGAIDLASTSSQDNEGIYSVTNDINDAGQIVGLKISGLDPFVWDSSTGMLNLNTLIDPNSGWDLDDALAINNNGQIVGYGTNKNGQKRAFLLTPKSHKPVPEPLTMGGTVIAGAGLAYLRRRQGRLRRSSFNNND
ncbi:HAF repeat-containing PEP-CTERM protein [Fischerella sp. PCC 9605]|uniref:HAF repeat-containing PEP-CTERM protein n=1 Tax=Fischerella sp. PCC 9605 TaxID=1173024 RepID=UPI00047AE34F|nr:HAF repeat-containing PEP-CTERM protein [Fischerella sp. PCC 9605]